MDETSFVSLYNASRNGACYFCKNPLYPRFRYSDGVQELAQTGCYWLVDLLGIEIPGVFDKNPGETLMIVEVTVQKNRAVIKGSFTDTETAYTRSTCTDLPEGKWNLYIGNDGDGVYRCILPSEY